MLAEAGFDAPAGGNLGTPLSEQVPASKPTSLHVVEVSSFQLETTGTFHPWIAVLLNLSADHLDRHASFEEYGAAKARIFANQTADGLGGRQRRRPGGARARATRPRAAIRFRARRATGSRRHGRRRRDRAPRRRRAAPLLPLAAVKLPGRHLLGDVLAAAAVGCLAGVPPAAMRRAVETFGGLEHALERVGDIDGVRFVNDSKATNIESARRAHRELRPRRRRDHGRPVQGRPLRGSARGRSRRGRGASWRSAKRGR